jgi:hypothetical protein
MRRSQKHGPGPFIAHTHTARARTSSSARRKRLALVRAVRCVSELCVVVDWGFAAPCACLPAAFPVVIPPDALCLSRPGRGGFHT